MRYCRHKGTMTNRLFPGSLVPLFQIETKYDTFHMDSPTRVTV